MKKKIIFILFGIILLFSLTSCISISINFKNDESEEHDYDYIFQNPPYDPTKLNFTNAQFPPASYTYDGNYHTFAEVTGVPEGTTIIYRNVRKHSEPGFYRAYARLSKKGYNDKVISGSLTITNAHFSGIKYEDKVVEYDGLDHKNDIRLYGGLPAGTTVSEKIYNLSGIEVKSAIEVGIYDFVCYLSKERYDSATLHATLTIKSHIEDTPVYIKDDGTIYFSNGEHNKYLYSLKDSEFKLIDSSQPKEFDEYDTTTPLFISNSNSSNSIKQIDNDALRELCIDDNIVDVVKYTDNIYYYCCNNNPSKEYGIYSLDLTNMSIREQSNSYSDNLAIYNDYIYFIDLRSGRQLYKMKTSSKNSDFVLQGRIYEFIISGYKLYCSINRENEDYIGVVDLTSEKPEVTKLTAASGEFLKVKGDYLYYNYTDLFSDVDSSLKGIWRININGGESEHIIISENINGFDVESDGSVIYIDSRDLHLYRYNVLTQSTTDLLDGFIKPTE